MIPALKKISHPLILASASTYKKQLLERLQFEFTCEAADIDEKIHAQEKPEKAALRLAKEKAEAIKAKHPDQDSLIIACDQVAYIDDGKAIPFIGKPGSKENAYLQLERSSGQTVAFHTAIHILQSAGCYSFEYADLTIVKYRMLNPEEIKDYLDREHALDCAGSAKIEGLGISLLESVESKDPSALIGLPLIELNKQLMKFLIAK